LIAAELQQTETKKSEQPSCVSQANHSRLNLTTTASALRGLESDSVHASEMLDTSACASQETSGSMMPHPVGASFASA